MKSKKPSRRQLRLYCADVHEDDGADPRNFFRQGKSPRKTGRKALQLCSQVADTLNFVFGEFHDEVLQGLRVVAVVPAPDASQLLVTVCPTLAPETSNILGEILNRLATVCPRVRSEVAAAITRKRAPKLLFRVVVTRSDKEQHA